MCVHNIQDVGVSYKTKKKILDKIRYSQQWKVCWLTTKVSVFLVRKGKNT